MLMTTENRFTSARSQASAPYSSRRQSPDHKGPPTSGQQQQNAATRQAKPIDDQYYDSTRVYLAPIPQLHCYATNPPKALASNKQLTANGNEQTTTSATRHNFNDENYSLDNQQPVPPQLEASTNNNNSNYHIAHQQQGLGTGSAAPFDIENYYMNATNDSSDIMNTDDVTYHIAQQIEFALHQARTTFLNCCQVSIPCKLTLLIAQDIVQMSESEPCGLRGCTLFINLEEKDFCQRIASFKFADPFSVATFEMYLTLKRVTPGWLNEVSNRILKNFGRNSIAISDLYKLSKKKLYRTASNQF